MFAATNTWMGDRLGIKRVCEEREEGRVVQNLSLKLVRSGAIL